MLAMNDGTADDADEPYVDDLQTKLLMRATSHSPHAPAREQGSPRAALHYSATCPSATSTKGARTCPLPGIMSGQLLRAPAAGSPDFPALGTAAQSCVLSRKGARQMGSRRGRRGRWAAIRHNVQTIVTPPAAVADGAED
jgi:hypothetical protein